MNLLLFRPFQRRGSKLIILFVLSIAVSLIVQAVLEWIYGGSSVTFSTSAGKPYHIGPFVLTAQELAIMGAAALAMILVHVILRYTKFGKAQRAVADSLNLAAVTGISVNAVIQTTWLMAGVLAGFAGYVLALNVGSFTPTTGFSFLLVIFAAAVLGRIGSIYGAMLGALVIGIATEVSALYIPADYKNSVAFGLLILTLLIRPAGLFARRAVTA
jgi:branched-subunit amino acid ABC-type transport system permease component